jgi:hypothetical protein
MISALLVLAASYELGSGVTPVQKVISLMNDMYAKAVDEKKAEEVAFTTFKQWCDNTASNKQAAIKKGEQLMEQLDADIAAADSDVVTLTDEIAELVSKVDAEEAAGKKAGEEREEGKKDYFKLHADLTESVESVQKAEKVLKSQMAASPAMLQMNKLPAKAVALLQEAPQVEAYEDNMGGMLKVFEDLEKEFKDQRNQAERDEMEEKHKHGMFMQSMQDTIEKLNKQKGRKEQRKAQRQEDSATAAGELKDTTAARDADRKYLEDTVAGCSQKSADFESRQSLRAEELEAIKKATEIIAGQAVSGGADKHLPAMVQSSLSLLRSVSAAEVQSKDRVAKFLSQKASELDSRTLFVLSQQAAADPFVKVRKMIRDMIGKLTSEAADESEHKGWCDSEVGANKIQRDAKTEDVNSLTAKKEQLTADIAKLGQELADLATELAELDKAVASASDMRAKENTKNTATIADAKAAQEAVKSALTVLKDFYAKAAEATALVQGPMDDAPSTFDTGFQGQQAESGGVIGMLEVIASDFARLESDTSTAEDSAADEYKTFTSDSAVDRAATAQDSDNKQKLKTRKEGELTSTNKDLKGSQSELDAALAYYDKLKPTCVDAGLSYEERVARREAEIQSLKEALNILNGEDI